MLGDRLLLISGSLHASQWDLNDPLTSHIVVPSLPSLAFKSPGSISCFPHTGDTHLTYIQPRSFCLLAFRNFEYHPLLISHADTGSFFFLILYLLVTCEGIQKELKSTSAFNVPLIASLFIEFCHVPLDF